MNYQDELLRCVICRRDLLKGCAEDCPFKKYTDPGATEIIPESVLELGTSGKFPVNGKTE